MGFSCRTLEIDFLDFDKVNGVDRSKAVGMESEW